MTKKLAIWLKNRLDIFELRVRASKFKGGRDTYWCAGWADGYKAAQKAARLASKEPPFDVTMQDTSEPPVWP